MRRGFALLPLLLLLLLLLLSVVVTGTSARRSRAFRRASVVRIGCSIDAFAGRRGLLSSRVPASHPSPGPPSAAKSCGCGCVVYFLGLALDILSPARRHIHQSSLLNLPCIHKGRYFPTAPNSSWTNIYDTRVSLDVNRSHRTGFVHPW